MFEYTEYAGIPFVSGAIVAGHLVAGLFFLRFWARTRDRLFLAFAIAFWVLALNQGWLALSGIPREEQSWIYLIRLAAFLLIIIAVVHKNMSAGPRTSA
jgi:Family of unknown function (DUF5985)